MPTHRPALVTFVLLLAMFNNGALSIPRGRLTFDKGELLFPFGPFYNDTQQDYTVQLASAAFRFPRGVPYLGGEIRRIRQGRNGILLLDHAGNSTVGVEKLPHPRLPALIAGYFVEVDPTRGGAFYTRLSRRSFAKRHGNVMAKNDVDRANFIVKAAQLSTQGPDEFQAKLVLVATWHNVLGKTGIGKNTFQIAVVSDRVETFVFLSFDKLDWMRISHQEECGGRKLEVLNIPRLRIRDGLDDCRVGSIVGLNGKTGTEGFSYNIIDGDMKDELLLKGNCGCLQPPNIFCFNVGESEPVPNAICPDGLCPV